MTVRHIENVMGKCPFCNREVAFTWVETSSSSDETGSITPYQSIYKNDTGIWALGECPSCKKCVTLHFTSSGPHPTVEIFPRPMPQEPDESIPNMIRKDLFEARKCLSVGAFRATVTMCRRTLQSAFIDKGAEKNTPLYKQIDELKEKGIITEEMQKWADSVRWVGNDGAHPENPEVTGEDAEEILKLTEAMMEILYILPEIAKEKSKVHGKKKT